MSNIKHAWTLLYFLSVSLSLSDCLSVSLLVQCKSVAVGHWQKDLHCTRVIHYYCYYWSEARIFLGWFLCALCVIADGVLREPVDKGSMSFKTSGILFQSSVCSSQGLIDYVVSIWPFFFFF